VLKTGSSGRRYLYSPIVGNLQVKTDGPKEEEEQEKQEKQEGGGGGAGGGAAGGGGGGGGAGGAGAGGGGGGVYFVRLRHWMNAPKRSKTPCREKVKAKCYFNFKTC